MLDAEKLKELQAKNIICEQEFVEQKHNLFNRIMRHENNPKAKNGIIYILLAWFVGTIGLHNFYAGYYWRGTVQLFLTLVYGCLCLFRCYLWQFGFYWNCCLSIKVRREYLLPVIGGLFCC